MHSKCSPSSLDRLIRCPASAQYDVAEKKDTVYTLEGTHLHDVTAKGIMDASKREHLLSLLLTREYRLAVKYCWDYLDGILDSYRMRSDSSKWRVLVEQRVYLNAVGLNDSDGVADVIIILPDIEFVVVVDWKFGKGVAVYAQDNYQGVAYVLGSILSACNDNLALSNTYSGEFHIVQPRLDSTSIQKYGFSELQDWSKYAVDRLGLIGSKDAPHNPGEKQCQWCNNKNFCRARHAYKDKLAESIFSTYAAIQNEEVVTFEDLSKAYVKCLEYKLYASEIEKIVKAQLLKGEKIPGWGLAPTRKNRKWKNQEQAENYLLSLGIDRSEMVTESFCSPAQAEDLVGKEEKKKPEFKELWVSEPGQPKVVREEKAQLISKRTAESTFSDYACNELE